MEMINLQDKPVSDASEIAHRAVNAINAALHDDISTLIVVTHGGTARCILGKMLDMPMNQCQLLVDSQMLVGRFWKAATIEMVGS